MTKIIAKVKNYPRGLSFFVSYTVWKTEYMTIKKIIIPIPIAINEPILIEFRTGKDAFMNLGINDDRLICQKSCPKIPVTM